MNLDNYLGIAAYGLETSLLVSAPVLLAGLLAGVSVSIFQAATQINDAALAFLPKILATVIALAIFGPWMISEMTTFTEYALQQIPAISQ